MNRFSFKARMIYFSIIALVSIGFFVLQWTANLDDSAGVGSVILLVLWGAMALFGIAGIILSAKARNKQ